MSLVEVRLKADLNPKVIVETLSRMGIANKAEKILYPSCYLLPEDGKYFICHFKELFVKDRKGFNNISDDDIKRRNTIIYCLVKWNMVEVVQGNIDPHELFIFTIPHREKSDWKIKHKFRINYE